MSATASMRRREVLLEDLTGLAAVNAIARLRELELRPAVEACDTDQPEQHGLVLAHDPTPDSAVRRAQLITLLVGQHAQGEQPPRRPMSGESGVGRRNGTEPTAVRPRPKLEPVARSAAGVAAGADIYEPEDEAPQLPDLASRRRELSHREDEQRSMAPELDAPTGAKVDVLRRTADKDDGPAKRIKPGCVEPRRRDLKRAVLLVALLSLGLVLIATATGLHEISDAPAKSGVVESHRDPGDATRDRRPRAAPPHRRPPLRPLLRAKGPEVDVQRHSARDAEARERPAVIDGPDRASANPESPSRASPTPIEMQSAPVNSVTAASAIVLPPSPMGPLPGPPPT